MKNKKHKAARNFSLGVMQRQSYASMISRSEAIRSILPGGLKCNFIAYLALYDFGV
jgi:hypothetical protein